MWVRFELKLTPKGAETILKQKSKAVSRASESTSKQHSAPSRFGKRQFYMIATSTVPDQ